MGLPRVLETESMDAVGDAAAYDAMDHSGPNGAFVQRLVDLGAGGRILDVGCGPGHLPLLICQAIKDCTITAIDISQPMLTIAQRHLAKSPYEHRIDYLQADAKDLPFDDASFDCVISNTTVHHLADPSAMLAQMHRVARPEGVYLVRDLYRPDTVEALDVLVALHAGDATFTQQHLFRDSLHAALSIDELRDLAKRLGLHDLELVVDSDRHMSLQRAASTCR